MSIYITFLRDSPSTPGFELEPVAICGSIHEWGFNKAIVRELKISLQ